MPDYGAFTKDLMYTPTYINASQEEQQAILRRAQESLISSNPDDESDIRNAVASENKSFRVGARQGRYIPTDIEVDTPWQQKDYATLSEDEKLARLDSYRNGIYKIAEQDSINAEDRELYLKNAVNQQERIAKGEHTGWLMDKGYRAFDGFATGILSGFGAQDLADEVRQWTAENPKYDEDFTSKLAEGIGGFGATTAIFLGATAISGGNPLGGTLAIAGTDAVQRYTQGYQQAIQSGLTDEEATRAGLGSLPAVAIDVFADRFLASKFLPRSIESVLGSASNAAKREAIEGIFTNPSYREILAKMSRSAFVQGSANALGDLTAGYGAFIATGNQSFIPDSQRVKDSFLIGSVIGGLASGGEAIHDYRNSNTWQKIRSNIDSIQDPSIHSQIYDLMAQGRLKDALNLSKESLPEVDPNKKSDTPAGLVIPDEQPIPAPQSTEIPDLFVDQNLYFNSEEGPKKAKVVGFNADEGVHIEFPDGEKKTVSPETLYRTPEEANKYLFIDGDQVSVGINNTEENGIVRSWDSVKNEATVEIEGQKGPEEIKVPKDKLKMVEAADRSSIVPDVPAGGMAIHSSGAKGTVVSNNNDLAVFRPESGNRNVIVPSSELKRYYDIDFNRPSNRGETDRYLGQKTFKLRDRVTVQQGDRTLTGTVINSSEPYTIHLDDPTAERTTVVANASEMTGSNDPNSIAVSYQNQDLMNQVHGSFLDTVQQMNQSVVIDPENQTAPKEPGMVPTEDQFVEPAPKKVRKRKSKADGTVANAELSPAPSRRGRPRRTPVEQSAQELINANPSSAELINIDQPQRTEQTVTPETPQAPTVDVDAIARDLGIEDDTLSFEDVSSIEEEPPVYLNELSESNIIDPISSDEVPNPDPTSEPQFKADQIESPETGEVVEVVDPVYQGVAKENQMTRDQLRQYRVDFVRNGLKDLDLGIEDAIAVVYDPTLRYSGRLIDRDRIAINSAYINGTEHLRNNIIHEAVHGVWDLPEIQDSWANVKATVTKEDIQSKIQERQEQGLEITPETALEEASVDKVIQQFQEENGPVRSFIDTLWNKIKEIFGFFPKPEDSDATKIIKEALLFLTDRKNIKLNEKSSEKALPSEAVQRKLFQNAELLGKSDYTMLQVDKGTRYHGYYLKEQFNGDVNGLVEFDAERLLDPSKQLGIKGWQGDIRKAFRDVIEKGMTFSELNDKLIEHLGSPQKVSEALSELGAEGIRINDKESILFNPQTTDGENFGVVNIAPAIFNAAPKRPEDSFFTRQFFGVIRSKINDRFDAHTRALQGSLSKIDWRAASRLLPREQFNRLQDIVQNVYESRVVNIAQPDLRLPTDGLLDELNLFRKAVDTAKIKDVIKSYDGTVDLSGYQGAPDDYQAFEAYTDQILNSLVETDDIQRAAPGTSNAYQNKQQQWRQSYSRGAQLITQEHASADQYLSNLENYLGSPSRNPDFVKAHFNYLLSIDPATLGGRDLYKHYFALNNLKDFSMMHMDLTVKHEAGFRDGQIGSDITNNLFRDPIVRKNKFLQTLDKVQKFTETKTSSLERMSAFLKGKQFLREQVMGPLSTALLHRGQNEIDLATRDYMAHKTQIEGEMGRQFSPDDAKILAMVSRLTQYEVGSDPHQAIKDNILNEYRAIDNKINKGSDAIRSEAANSDLPMLEQLIKDVQDSEAPMDTFMGNIEYRVGEGDERIGGLRLSLLNKMQDIASRFTTDVKIFTEGLHKKRFREIANYLHRRAIPIEAEHIPNRDMDLTDEMQDFEDVRYQTNAMTGVTNQQKDRVGIGNNAHYSNNIEHVFERTIRTSALISATTPERFILAERLKDGGKLNTLIDPTPTSDLSGRLTRGTYRVNYLKKWGSDLFRSAMSTGAPLGDLGRFMRTINGAYTRVALSGVHQGASQIGAGYVDYHTRTNNIEGAMDAARYYINNREKVNDWIQTNAARMFNRSFMGENTLDRRKLIPLDESRILASPIVKKMESIADGAGKVLISSLRFGDDFVARSLLLAEYSRLIKQKGANHENISDMDFSQVDGDAMTQAMLNLEKNFNASDKITRGELFTDRNPALSAVRDSLLAFSSSSMNLAAQFNIAVRDLIDLHQSGAPNEEKLAQIKNIGAILAQTTTFATSRFAINGLLATGMTGLMQDLFDDEDGKIEKLSLRVEQARRNGDRVALAHAQNELAMAQGVRKQLLQFQAKTTSFDSFFKNTLKEDLGSISWVFAGPGLPQKMAFMVYDTFEKRMYQEDRGAQMKEFDMKIADARKHHDDREVARLTEQKTILGSQEYIPFNVTQMDNIGMGGINGTVLQAGYNSIKEANDYMQGLTEYNWNDVALASQSLGMGQADLNRMFRAIDKIEDDQYKTSGKLEAQIQQAREDEKKSQIARRKRLMRSILSEN